MRRLRAGQATSAIAGRFRVPLTGCASLSLFEERSAAGRTAIEINDLGRAATLGAVETLFVDIDAKLAGTIDEQSGAVSLDDVERRDYGVADELCRRVILAGGTVLAVRAAEVPGGGSAAAILRYPV